MKLKKLHIIIGTVILLLVICIGYGFYTGLRVTRIEYENEKIPKEFDGYKIIQLSDLHCAVFGKNQSKLIERIKEEAPDLIVLTGDMYDRKRWDYNSLQTLLEGISDIAPVYAITGNNEYDDKDMYAVLLELYEEYGITLLEDERVELQRGNAKIYLYGMYYRYYVTQQYFDLEGEHNQFNILLYHDPSQFDRISKNSFDLILAGHTHGGIVRLPFVGGLISNSGAFFPKYDYGMYYTDECDMYVSTGLGNLDIPRYYNRPEIVSITLKAQ